MIWLLPACAPDPDPGATTGPTSVTPPAPTTPPAPALSEEDQAAFDALIADVEADLATYGVPGAQVAVVIDGVIATASLGVRGVDNDLPVDGGTRFRWASLSKSATAAMVLDVAGEGALSLDDAPETWVPTFFLAEAPSPTGTTLHQALTHTSGIPDFTMSACPAYATVADAFLDTPGPQLAPPGAVFNYSNTGFALAALAAENAAGAPWEELLRERVFDPLGMSVVLDLDTVDAEGNRAVGTFGTEAVDTHDVDCVLWGPPAGIWGTADDLGRWLAELLDPQVLPDAIAAMRTPHVETRMTPDTDYGYGLYVTERSDHVLIGHDARLAGFSAAMYLVPELGIGVGILVNADVYPGNTALAGLDRFLGWSPDVEDWSTDPATWEEYAGSYVDPWVYGPWDVAWTGTGLLLSVPEAGLLDAPMTQVAADHFDFVAEGMVLPMTFWRETPDAPPRWFVYRYGVGDREVAAPSAARSHDRWPPGPVLPELGPTWVREASMAAEAFARGSAR